jgi:hypothetical protein
MENLVLQETMTALGCAQEGGVYALPEGARASCILVHGSATLTITKVRKIEQRDLLLVLTTDEGRTFTSASSLVAVRVEEQDRVESRPGFHR